VFELDSPQLTAFHHKSPFLGGGNVSNMLFSPSVRPFGIGKASRSKHMKFSFAGIVAAAIGVTSGAHAASYNLAELISTGDSITIGDKTFGNFGFSSSDFSSSDAVVTPSVDGNGIYYLSFSGPWVAISSTKSLNFEYSIATTSGQRLISAIDQSFVLSAAGTAGSISVTETASNGSPTGPTIGQSTLSFVAGLPPALDLEDPVAEAGDDLIIEGASSRLHILTSVLLEANRVGIVGASTITQSFHQVRPGIAVSESGATVAMMGATLLGLGYLRRRTA